MTRTHLVPALVVAGLAVAAAADAQSRGWIDSSRVAYADERQSYNDARRVAYDNGFREGVKEGEKDGRRGDAFAYRDERDFQRADRGYHRSLGSVERYREVYRTGYAAGYEDGYRRYGRYTNGRGNGRYSTRPGYPGGSYPGYPGGYGQPYPGRGYYNPAFDYGVKDGYEKGVEDARKNRSYDVLRHKWYREGDRHYDDDYGRREQYKDVYREGFKEGYDRGFREGRYR
jgi:flagellar biosynthesis/type III secretory pathway protein FliH